MARATMLLLPTLKVCFYLFVAIVHVENSLTHLLQKALGGQWWHGDFAGFVITGHVVFGDNSVISMLFCQSSVFVTGQASVLSANLPSTS